jgi:alkylhydroperoxidase family enzyme
METAPRTMSRISLLEEFPAEAGDFVERVRRQRRGTLLKLYKALLHSPPLAESWFGHMNAVRWGTTLSGRLRELIIIRIAAIHAAAYVIRQHVPALAEADGVSVAECEALKDWRHSASFDAAERAALAYCDSMTTEVNVAGDVFEALRPHYSERQIVEITVLAATYNMHVRVIQALEIAPEDR